VCNELEGTGRDPWVQRKKDFQGKSGGVMSRGIEHGVDKKSVYSAFTKRSKKEYQLGVSEGGSLPVKKGSAINTTR